jgi:hypothetical protein
MREPLAGVIERLYREFPTVPLTELIELVRRCRDDIDTGAPPDCLAELVERLARARLAAACDDAATRPPPQLADEHNI